MINPFSLNSFSLPYPKVPESICFNLEYVPIPRRSLPSPGTIAPAGWWCLGSEVVGNMVIGLYGTSLLHWCAQFTGLLYPLTRSLFPRIATPSRGLSLVATLLHVFQATFCLPRLQLIIIQIQFALGTALFATSLHTLRHFYVPHTSHLRSLKVSPLQGPFALLDPQHPFHSHTH